ncbi:MAG TPA: metallophosphoesterase [Candidatus Obscuribacterales bacterium]
MTIRTDSEARSVAVWPYLIGDIHGCYQEYLSLEGRIQQHARQHDAEPLFVSVGDLVDRGPDSAGVVAHFFKGQQLGTHRAILGNHELMMLQVLFHLAPWNFEQPGCAWPLRLWTLSELHGQGEGMARYLSWEDYLVTMKSLWLGQGGFQTLHSYGMDPEDTRTWNFSPMILEYLLNLPLYWEQAEVVVTHALAQPEDLARIRRAVEDNPELDREYLIELKRASHSLLWNRSLPAGRPDPERQHVSGHTPIRRIRRWKLLQCVQIDTGCVYGRRLTAYCLPLNTSISVAAEKNYLAAGV